MFGIGYKKFEFSAHKKNQSLSESNRALKKVLWDFHTVVFFVFCIVVFFRAFVNLLVETAMTTEITFDEFVKPKPTFSV